MFIKQFTVTKVIGVIVVIVLVLVIARFISSDRANERGAGNQASDHRNATFMIEGRAVQLVDGYAEEPIAEDIASKIITKYFGNELTTDLDGDGEEDDVAFILTQDHGGSGTFFYAVAAISTDEGFKGTDGYFLGDRIAPQATTVSPNPGQKNVVVFNYADHASGEPVSAQPSIGKSVYLKVSMPAMRWGIVVPDFEGESREAL